MKESLSSGIRQIMGAHFSMDYASAKGGLILEQEWVQGLSLADVMVVTPFTERCLSDFIEILCMCHSYHASPLRILHGDISPQNIIRSEKYGASVFMLIDWEEVSSVHWERLVRRRRRFRAKPAYMSPERADSGVNSISAEVFALGAILYEWLTGQTVVPNSNQGFEKLLARNYSLEFSIETPCELKRVLEKSLATDPQKRYPNLLAFCNDLRQTCL